jgi:hypothetical protein
MSYNFKDFDAQFPDDAACLHHIFLARFANHVCECGKSGCFYRIAKRRTYCCAWCGAMISPTAGTIFHKSETSLKTWFFAIFLFAKSKNGVAAKELTRHLSRFTELDNFSRLDGFRNYAEFCAFHKIKAGMTPMPMRLVAWVTRDELKGLLGL